LSDEKDKLYIRLHTEDDLNFIYATWLKSYRSNSIHTKRVPKELYFDYQQQAIRRIIENERNVISIACSYLDPVTIFGYLIYHPPIRPKAPYILHYAYVKQDMRGLNIFHELLKEAAINFKRCIFTHWTNSSEKLWVIYPGLTFSPQLF